MKTRFVIALVGLAISLALPAFAQEKDSVDPKIAEQIRDLANKMSKHTTGRTRSPLPRSMRRTASMSRLTTEHFTVDRPSRRIMRSGIFSFGITTILLKLLTT
jgi:hypothetical protein